MKVSIWLVARAFLPFIFQTSLAGQVTSIVKVSGGAVNGNPRDSNGIISFKGIPFARPPVGTLRWTSPQAPNARSGTLNATTFGYTCWNNLIGCPVFTPFNEDCLTINVWTGSTSTTEILPVMFWIYGVDFNLGTPLNQPMTAQISQNRVRS